jgi:hypothetical protein
VTGLRTRPSTYWQESLVLPVDQRFRFVRSHSRRAKKQIALKDAVNLDLPIVAYEMPGVRRDDLDLVTVVNELGRRGHSAIRIDAEIWRISRHLDLVLATGLVEKSESFLADLWNHLPAAACGHFWHIKQQR